MTDCFGEVIKIGDKVAHIGGHRSSTYISVKRVVGFTKLMVVLEGERKVGPHKCLIVNNDGRFVEGKTLYL